MFKASTSEDLTVICCRILAFCMFQTVLAALLAKFTFRNPDTSNCWVVPDEEVPYSEPQGIEGEVNMSERFHYWFFAGFIACSTSIVIGILEVICYRNYCI